MNIVEFFREGWFSEKVENESNGSQTVTVDETAKTMTLDSGTWSALGVAVGDKITTTGFAAGGNNGTFEVTALDGAEATLGNATGLADVTDDTGVTVLVSTKVVTTGARLIAYVLPGSSETVTLQDSNESAQWANVTDTGLDIQHSPLKITGLRLNAADAAETWIIYKAL